MIKFFPSNSRLPPRIYQSDELKKNPVDIQLAEIINTFLLKKIESHQSDETYSDEYTYSAPPPISLEDYCLRYMKYLTTERSVYILSLIYLDRYFKIHPQKKLTPLNTFMYLTCSLLVAYKFLIDDIHDTRLPISSGGLNAHIDTLSGVLDLMKLHRFEIKFLIELDYRLFVSVEEYNDFSCSIAHNGGADCREVR